MVYRGNETESEQIKLPKNIRQIGEGGSADRVYLEDYAVTYLHQVKAAVLLGEIRKSGGHTYYFVNGALEVTDAGFPEEIWEQVYREAKEYFEGRDVIGWYARSMGGTWKITEEMERVYRGHFEKEQPVLILYDEDEEEEGIFLAENGTLVKQRGYYIYYEKNQLMQDYMVWKNTGKSVEKEAQVSDSAIRSFRKIIESKTQRVREKNMHSRLVYGAGAFLVLTVFAIGITMIQNYDKMKEVEQTVENMAQGMTETVQPSIQVTASVTKETETDSAQGMAAADLASMNMPEDTQLASQTGAAVQSNMQTQAGNEVQNSAQIQDENGTQSDVQTQTEDGVQSSVQTQDENGTQSDVQTQTEDGVQSSVQTQAGNGTQSDAQTQTEDGIQSSVQTQTGNGTQSDVQTQAENGIQSNIQIQVENEAGNSSGTQTETAAQGSNTDQDGSETEAPSLDESESAKTEEAVSRSMQAQYVIKEGDTLADVCEMYYGSMDMIDSICELNNIENPNQILPGQKIVLP